MDRLTNAGERENEKIILSLHLLVIVVSCFHFFPGAPSGGSSIGGAKRMEDGGD